MRAHREVIIFTMTHYAPPSPLSSLLWQAGCPHAHCGMAHMFSHGKGVEQSHELALYHHLQAADTGLAIAQYVGGCDGVPTSLKRSESWDDPIYPPFHIIES